MHIQWISNSIFWLGGENLKITDNMTKYKTNYQRKVIKSLFFGGSYVLEMKT